MDQDGDVLDILVTSRRDTRGAKRFFRRVLKQQGRSPWQLVTDKVRSYPAGQREVFPSVTHRTGKYENNRAEVSHQHTREQERQVRGYNLLPQFRRFLHVHSPIHDLFRAGRRKLNTVRPRLHPSGEKNCVTLKPAHSRASVRTLLCHTVGAGSWYLAFSSMIRAGRGRKNASAINKLISNSTPSATKITRLRWLMNCA